MRLHNRQIKATFWTDPHLLQWPKEKRWFYLGLSQLADDSGCLEDSPFAFKIHLFPSPLDTDISVERIIQWREEMVSEGKLIAYTSGGKPYLFIANFHKHQTLDTPTPPSKASIPLPPWVQWVPGDTRKKSKYIVRDMSRTSTENVPVELEPELELEPLINNVAPDGARYITPAEKSTTDGAQTDGTESHHDEGIEPGSDADETPKAGSGDEYTSDFEQFWSLYPRRKEKRKAWRAWQARLKDKKKRSTPDQMIQGARNYAAVCKKTEECFIKLPATFLGPDRHFEEFIAKEWSHGTGPKQTPGVNAEISKVFDRSAFEYKSDAL